MKEEKRKRKKKVTAWNLFVGSLLVVMFASCVLLFFQYHRLTEAFIQRGTEENMLGTEEMSVKERAEPVSEKTETQRLSETETMAHGESELQEEETKADTERLETDMVETEFPAETAMEIIPEAETVSDPSWIVEPVPEELQALDLTIEDIPNSLYARFQNPEELRTTLFAWLKSQGIESMECTCGYEYEDDGENLYFQLRFATFLVEAVYSPASNVYTYGILSE